MDQQVLCRRLVTSMKIKCGSRIGVVLIRLLSEEACYNKSFAMIRGKTTSPSLESCSQQPAQAARGSMRSLFAFTITTKRLVTAHTCLRFQLGRRSVVSP